MKYSCDNCSNPTLARGLEDNPNLHERLDPGSTVPAGECQCGALIYLIPESKPDGKAKHTPEPWALAEQDDEGHYVVEALNGAAAICYGAGFYSNNPPPANGERIVACVNACKGINPEAVPDLLAALEDLLESANNFAKRVGWPDNKPRNAARAALAKAQIEKV